VTQPASISPVITLPHLQPRPLRKRRHAPTLIDVELAPEQRAAVELPAGRSLLILGEAGHGKTTVALHRIAHLWRQAAEGVRACVIVPTSGLERWLQPLLTRLGADVEVLAWERWARAQARRVFRDLPARESEDATPAVARLKRHPALLPAIATRAATGTPERRRARRTDLLHLFGDRAVLDAVAQEAGGSITPRMVADVLEHTHVQFSRTAEEEWSHVTDRKRLVAVDGLALDVGTASADARSVDTEDYAVMFELDRLRAQHRGVPAHAPPAYDLVMIDEAQELAPIELALVGRSVAPGGTLVVAGDPAQQIDPSVTFTSWEASLRALGCEDPETVTLGVGYAARRRSSRWRSTCSTARLPPRRTGPSSAPRSPRRRSSRRGWDPSSTRLRSTTARRRRPSSRAIRSSRAASSSGFARTSRRASCSTGASSRAAACR
jgi:hypothetical protein